MPVQYIHMGFGVARKRRAGRFSLSVFSLVQGLIDPEPLGRFLAAVAPARDPGPERNRSFDLNP